MFSQVTHTFPKSHTPYKLRSVVVCLVVIAMLLTACGGDDQDEDKKNYKVGIFNPIALEVEVGLKSGLAEHDYTEGDNVTYVSPEFTGFDPASLGAAAQALVDEDVDVIVCVTSFACALMQAPVDEAGVATVFLAVADPLGAGLAADWAQPGGNFTGIASNQRDLGNEARRLEFLVDADPSIARVYLPWNVSDPSSQAKVVVLREAAAKLEITLVEDELETGEDADAAVAALPADVDAVFQLSERIFGVESLILLADNAIVAGLPYSAPAVDYGALVSYSSDLDAMGRQSARLVDQILTGTSAGELPIEAPEFFLAVNLVTADALGLEIAEALLNQADTIVRAEDNAAVGTE